MKTIQDLAAIRESLKQLVDIRTVDGYKPDESAADYSGKYHIMVCAGPGCETSNSLAIAENLEAGIKANGLEKDVKVVRTGCLGLCAMAPIVVTKPDGVFYCEVQPEDADAILKEHIIGGTPVRRLQYDESEGKDPEAINTPMEETAFYNKQLRLAMRNCGRVNPEEIDEYLAFDGYKALEKALLEMTPDGVVDVVLESGIRGRGGAGFPVGRKWKAATRGRGEIQKYVVCNADEGDPGAFMDRSVLEGDPHSVLEAMAIAGYAIGSDKGYVYVRAEYPTAVKRLTIALMQARTYGLIGENILGTGFNFDVEIKLGAGAFVCGESSALMKSIEGYRGEPRPRPPSSAVKGLYGQPTLLNNVETFANIPQIILKGSEWYSSIGTEKSKGTKVFSIVGKVKNVGLAEVPMGTTLREIIEDVGGGIPGGKKFKAAQTGGPSGGCIPPEHLDTPIDFDNLAAIGSMMGSGGLIVLDEETCMVDTARFFLDFTVDESCGKCTPCRVGTRRMLEILEKITQGKATLEDLDNITELAHFVETNSFCGLGQTAPNPVLSTLRYFHDEYVAHIVEKRCPAGVCKALLEYSIDAEKCVGCTLCTRACPVDAISGEAKAPHVIDNEKCIKCGECISKCNFDAVKRG